MLPVAVALPVALPAPSLPPLTVKGRDLVDPAGKPVWLHGVNTGNWLLIEFWMLGLSGKPGTPPDQYTLVESLKSRFGEAEAERLMDLYRSSWMTERDWRNIRSYGFNLVRVPIDYRLLEDDARPKVLRKDAWQWLDKAVDEAEAHGLYAILDLHGVQGGQTPNDHTGRSGQNKLWTSPEDQDRMMWLWTQIARRYKGRTAVVAYDPMNEPYGGPKDLSAELYARAYRAIRKEDPKKLVFFHGHPDSFDHFGDLHAKGFTNVGIQMHYYPGLFGDPSTVRSQLRHLASLPRVEDKIVKLDVPFLVGEMNVVLNSSGGAAMMRKTFDVHERYDWLTTIWSYKVLSERGGVEPGGQWGTFVNRDPLTPINLSTASKAEIEGYFRSFATQPLVPYTALRDALTAKSPKLPDFEGMAGATMRTVAPARETLAGWTATDVGGALAGGLKAGAGGAFDLYGGGDDIWSTGDSFRFLHRAARGDFRLAANVTGIEDIGPYVKAGLMVRASTAPDAPAALLSVFPDGGAQLAVRSAPGAAMEATNLAGIRLPAKLRVAREGRTLVFSVDGTEVARRKIPALAGPVLAGPVALSHSGGELVRVGYRDLEFAGEEAGVRK